MSVNGQPQDPRLFNYGLSILFLRVKPSLIVHEQKILASQPGSNFFITLAHNSFCVIFVAANKLDVDLAGLVRVVVTVDTYVRFILKALKLFLMHF